MQLTMPSEPARAVSTAINTLRNLPKLKVCAILVKGYWLKVIGYGFRVSSRQSEALPTRSISVGCDEGRFISPEERASALLSHQDLVQSFPTASHAKSHSPSAGYSPFGDSSGELKFPSSQPTLSYRVGALLEMTETRGLVFRVFFREARSPLPHREGWGGSPPYAISSELMRLSWMPSAISFLSFTSGRKMMRCPLM